MGRIYYSGSQTSVGGHEMDLFETGQGQAACCPEGDSELPDS